MFILKGAIHAAASAFHVNNSEALEQV
jgi:hypothetical protein